MGKSPSKSSRTRDRSCAFEECDRPLHGSTWCGGHYQQLKMGKSLTPLNPRRTSQEVAARDRRGRKQCRECREWFPPESYRASNSKSGLWGDCEPCRRAKRQASHHGTTRASLRIIYDQQNGDCPVCNEALSWEGWHIDHDHTCCPGKFSCGNCIRGLLHSGCNTLLGWARDDSDILRNAAAYLDERK